MKTLSKLVRRMVLLIVLVGGVAIAATTIAIEKRSEDLQAQDIYVVDGDTIEVAGQRYRLVGYDTPETYRARCDSELALGTAATERLRELIASGQSISLVRLGREDQYQRELGHLIIGGRDVGQTLTNEDLARPYRGGSREGWCS